MKLHLPKMLAAAVLAAVYAATPALAESDLSYILTFGKEGTTKQSWADQCLVLTTGPASVSQALGDTGVTMGVTISTGRVWTTNGTTVVGDTWNTAAISDMNSVMGTTLTNTDLNGLCTAASAGGGSTNTFSLGSTTGAINRGDSITIYVGVTGTNAPYTPSGSYNVTGLASGYTVQYATAGGEGFSDTAGWTEGQGGMTIVKITGTVSNASSITFGLNDGTHKVGADFIAFSVEAGDAQSFVWAGSAEGAKWGDSVWHLNGGTESVAYVSGETSNAIFNAGAVSTVGVDANVTVADMTVSDNYTFAMENNAAITAMSLNLGAGKGVSLTGSGSLSAGALVIGGNGTNTLSLAEGTSMNLGGVIEIGANRKLVQEGAGSLTVATLRSTGGDIELSGSVHVTGGDTGQGDGNNKLGLALTAGGGQIRIKSGTTVVSGATYLGGSASGALRVGMDGSEAKLVTRRIELGDISGGSSTLEIGSQGTIVVTSTNDTNGNTGTYKTTGLILSEWGNTTTANVAGKLLAKDVHLYSGDTKFNLNIQDGGVVAVKGIAQNIRTKDTVNNISLAAGGKLVLGSAGIAADNQGAWAINLNGGEVGMSAEAVTIAKNATLAGSVTFNTAQYTFNGTGADQTLEAGTAAGTMTVSGVLSGEGSLVKTGNGTLVLSGANTYTGSTTVNGGTLDIRAEITLSSAIANSGTVVFNSDINATGLTVTEGSTGYTDINGVYTADGNGFETATGGSITIASGSGTITANNHTVTQDGVAYTIQADGTAISGTSGTTYSTYYQTEGSVSTSDIAAAAEGHGIFSAAVVSGSGVLEVDSYVAFISADGGEVHMTQSGGYQFLQVDENTVISGDVDYESMVIEAGKTATMNDGVTSGGVVFSSDESGVKLTNTGAEASTYSIDSVDAKVTADSMVANNGSEDVTISNQLAVKAISNEGAGKLIVDGAVDGLESLAATSGDITLQKVEDVLAVTSLSIGENKTVAVYAPGAETANAPVESTLNVTETLTTATGSTLLSNLVLGDNVTLTLNGALALGSQLTLGNSMTLDGDVYNQVLGMEAGDKVDLITSAANTTLTYAGNGYDGQDANTYFSNLAAGQYTIVADGTHVAIQKTGSDPVVPEPTTGTLSLLALAGLMARRRRK